MQWRIEIRAIRRLGTLFRIKGIFVGRSCKSCLSPQVAEVRISAEIGTSLNTGYRMKEGTNQFAMPTFSGGEGFSPMA